MSVVAAVLCAVAARSARASAWYEVPPVWLDHGGAQAGQSPEFFWVHELMRIAAPFKPTQERVLPKDRAIYGQGESEKEQSTRIDMKDFREAMKDTPGNQGAIAAHKAARDAIAAVNEASASPALPQEPDSEFADYDRGAFAFHRGEKHYQEAALAWEALLQRPPEQRHYRTVWAAFMLGKLKLFAHDPEAVKWMRKTRQLAKEGFADSLGLAADSYGWEAKSQLEQDHLERAAQLYLTQLALDDDSAIVSLKALVPDRENTFYMDFIPPPPANGDAAAMKSYQELCKHWQDAKLVEVAKLERAARDPLLRRIVTAHILAISSVPLWNEYDAPDGNTRGDRRCLHWLAALEKASLGKVGDADRLAWIAYAAGRYAEAERWLKLSEGETSRTLWLKSKLLFRAGKLAEATKVMEAARNHKPVDEADNPLDRDATGFLGSLYLAQGDFRTAEEMFESGGAETDVWYIKTRVLTIDELKKRVDRACPWTATADAALAKQDAEGPSQEGAEIIYPEMRWLLGRRLMRADRYEEAPAYLPPAMRALLDKYVALLKAGANEKLPRLRRARAWFDAAMILHHSGTDLMGMGFSNIASERETGTPQSVIVPVTASEKKRLAGNRDGPYAQDDVRFIEAGLEWKAAVLLPDETDELADVLNWAGIWIDRKAAEKFYEAIERRASTTRLGKLVLARHGFAQENDKGPWSPTPQQEEEWRLEQRQERRRR